MLTPYLIIEAVLDVAMLVNKFPVYVAVFAPEATVCKIEVGAVMLIPKLPFERMVARCTFAVKKLIGCGVEVLVVFIDKGMLLVVPTKFADVGALPTSSHCCAFAMEGVKAAIERMASVFNVFMLNNYSDLLFLGFSVYTFTEFSRKCDFILFRKISLEFW